MYFTRSAVNKAKGLKRLNLGGEYIVSDIILYTFLYLSEIVHNRKKNAKGQLIGKDLMLGKTEGAVRMRDPRRHGRETAASAKKARGRNQAHLGPA